MSESENGCLCLCGPVMGCDLSRKAEVGKVNEVMNVSQKILGIKGRR